MHLARFLCSPNSLRRTSPLSPPSPHPARPQIVARSWCRVGAGTYKGDLCFVESTQQHSTKASSSNSATIKLIPRLDMAQLATREKARFGSVNGSALAPHCTAMIALEGGQEARGCRISGAAAVRRALGCRLSTEQVTLRAVIMC